MLRYSICCPHAQFAQFIASMYLGHRRQMAAILYMPAGLMDATRMMHSRAEYSSCRTASKTPEMHGMSHESHSAWAPLDADVN